MHKIAVFLNPHAGKSHSHNWCSTIKTALFRSDIEFIQIDDVKESQRVISLIKNNQIDTVITVGGDGTIHYLLQQVAGTQARFLVLPGGTANDLSHELGHSHAVNKALEYVRLDQWKEIDLISVNGNVMATNGGIGLVGDVAGAVDRYRKKIPAFVALMTRLGHRIYSAVLGVKLLTDRSTIYHLKIEAKEFSGVVKTPIFLVNNQPLIAGSFRVAPETKNNDGMFNVTIFLHQDFLDLALAIDRVRRDIPPIHDPKIISFETREVKVTLINSDAKFTNDTDNSRPITFFGDGEKIAEGQEFLFKICPKGLKVVTDLRLSNQQITSTCTTETFS